MLLLVRSAYNGAINCHDANTSLFWKIPVEKLGIRKKREAEMLDMNSKLFEKLMARKDC